MVIQLCSCLLHGTEFAGDDFGGAVVFLSGAADVFYGLA